MRNFWTLIGYGAPAISPYMSFESLNDMIEENMLEGYTYAEAEERYVYGAMKGIIKVMAKMGISTIKSYRGAQIFEAVGLNQDVVDRYFTWTTTQVQGMSIEDIAREVLQRHEAAFPAIPTNGQTLDIGGHYQWRRGGEHHLFNPKPPT